MQAGRVLAIIATLSAITKGDAAMAIFRADCYWDARRGQKSMGKKWRQSRVKLIDLTASLDKEEATLEPLVSAEHPDADKIRTQISRVADARSELEKANANMLLGLRLLLTPDQWKSLQAGTAKPRPRKMTNKEDSSPVPRKSR